MSRIPESGSQNEPAIVADQTDDRYSDHHHSWMMCPMVAATKLTRPRLPSRLIEEESRLQLLDRSAAVPFTLVSAPAGFGKTTLVTQWLDARKSVHAWLTIDARDDSPHLFWRSISAALARVDSSLGLRESTLLAALEPGAAVDPVALLINRLMEYARTWQATQRLFLVLDDFHQIRHVALLEQFRRFIDYAPGLLRVICISRTDPPIRIAQLLARDQILKLGADQLCFDLELTRRFLTLRRKEASQSDITRLHARTGGWPAALQLSALSPNLNDVVGDEQPSSEMLAAYLLEEVFGQLETPLQQFLLDVSLLPVFSESLANQALDQENAGRHIAEMRRHNLLLQRYGSGQGWYRLHDLLADWLRPQVQDVQRRRRIRMAAANAFEKLGLINEALDLLIAEECYDEAEALIPALLQTEDLAGHQGLAEQFPSEIRQRSAPLLVLQALFSFLDGRFDQTMAYGEKAEVILSDQVGEIPDDLRFIALLLRYPSARFTGQQLIAETSIQELSARLDSSNSSLRNWGLYTLGLDAFMDADLELAYDILSRAMAGAFSVGDLNCVLRCLAVLLPVLVHQGRILEAVRCFNRTGEKLASLPAVRDQEAMLSYLDGLLALEQNQLDRARSSLEEASRLAPERMNLLDRMYLAFECFRAGMVASDEAVWRSSLDDIVELHHMMGGGDWTYNIPEPSALLALARIGQGDWSGLIAWSNRADDSIDPKGKSSFSCLHDRLLVLAGRMLMGAAVDGELEQLALDAGKGSNGMLLCRVRVMQVLILIYRDDDWASATRLLASTLDHYVPTGVVRPFLDADPRLVEVLEKCVHSGQASNSAKYILTQFAGSDSQVGSVSEPALQEHDSASEPLPEPLSQRERHVLRLLSEGLSNKVMSQHLGITVATVKSHLSNIYGKLDACNRGRAVARARSLGILE
ncbi:LuxR C-terminal-related transcriptional regulator [Marinobacter sp. CHS3-4]|uniref:LuxR C-terminal-related transcriptional regulator n=1 Tax=Marinobacter sp. CHS3-4 TaxID=3045174 RepID=UPI0024B502AF|nr:LuxR C-terminal-related transcriptional regulator [Marinobacter sp. CHS3-4]MDI9243654.1 LuxR C-terminal-related transcriptional regulator [Marinobacter sp. CHS3-4]